MVFAKQRAHYFMGGGYAGDDPVMEEMRGIIEVIRSRLERGQD